MMEAPGKAVRVGMLGCGNVGSAVARLLRDHGSDIERRAGCRLDLARVAVRNEAVDRDVPVPKERFTTDAGGVVADPDVDVVIELIGGIEPARTLILDALKGTAAVLIAGIYGPELALAAGFGAFLGHLFPVWLGFKGGKGVATYLGVLAGLAWNVALVFAALWLAVAFIMRYSSLAALVASLAVPLTLFYLGLVDYAVLFAVMTVIVFIKHRANISRLLAGTESRIGAKG
jgi:glycerol-3-phosphate acyltransferase PlsY